MMEKTMKEVQGCLVRELWLKRGVDEEKGGIWGNIKMMEDKI